MRPPVRISDTLLPWLEAARGPYLVMYRGRPVAKIAKAWRAARQRAGLGPEFVPTTWRHTLTTWFDEQGVADREIDDWFGRGRPERSRTGETYRHTRIY